MRPLLRLPTLLALLGLLGPAAAQESPGADVPRPQAAARAKELLATAEATRELGGPDQAMAALVSYEQAAAWAAQGRASTTYARARLGKALSLRALGRPGEALEALEEAVGTARGARLRELLVELLDRESELAEAMGLVAQAVRATREAALVRDELGLVEEAIAGFLRLAELELSRDGGRAAAPALQAALERARRSGLPGAMRAALESQVELSLAQGDARAARRAAEELLGLGADSPDGSDVGPGLVLLGRSLSAGGERDAAVPILRDAASSCAEAGDASCEADAREVLAVTLLELDAPREAVQEVLGLVAARRSLGDAAGELRAHFALAQAFRQLGQLQPALAALTEAERLARESAPRAVRAALRVEKARLLTRTRSVLESADAWDEALELASLPEDGRTWPDAPTALLHLPRRELLQRERLDSLVEAGLWARALTSCLPCTGEAGPRSPSLDALRDITLSQDATLLTWRALDDSLLGWALTADGRLLGARVEGMGARELAELAGRVGELAERVEVPEAGARSSFEGDDLRRGLRRLHDALIGPLEAALPPPGEALLLQPAPETAGLPWGLLLGPRGEWLGSEHGLAELEERVESMGEPGTGTLRVVADLRDPRHPGMDTRRLVARLDGEERRRLEAEAAGAARDEPERSRSRSSPGRRRASNPPPSPAPPAPLAGERRYGDGWVVLAGADWVPERLDALSPELAVLLLKTDCSEFDPVETDGAFVVLPSCAGEEADAAARRLLEAGARSVLLLRWDPGTEAREALVAGLVASLEPGTSPAEALATASGAGLPTTVWGALRVLGAAR